MSATIRKRRVARQKRSFQEGQRRIKNRLANIPRPERPIPMMTATDIHYEHAKRVRGLGAGGIGAILLKAQKIELDKEIGKGQMRLFEEYRYFFYITNDREMSAEDVVFSANGRCNQENLIAQLKGGVHALTAPVDNLVSNWAYMVMAGLAWSLKAGSGLLVPVTPRHEAKHEAERRTLLRMEFATYRAAFIAMPCQIVRGGRRLIYRMLSRNPWQGVFLRPVERSSGCTRAGRADWRGH